MAAPRVAVRVQDGAAGTVPETKVAEVEAAGGHVMSPAEDAAAKKQAVEASKSAAVHIDPADAWLAAQHALVSHTAGNFGVPVDEAAVDVASLFGDKASEKTRTYLKGLEERNPLTSAYFGAIGDIQGGLAAAELVGAPGRVSAGVVPRTVAGLAARATAGGVENVVQSTTRDINENALGKTTTNGEKLFANIPKHFMIGAGATVAFEGLAAGVEKAAPHFLPKAAAAADRQASAAIGREVGEAGEAGVAAGERIRRAAPTHIGREVPRNPSELVSVLEGEQGAARAARKETHAGLVDTLEGKHTSEAANAALRHEGMRGGVAARGRAGVEAAEAARGESILDAMGRGGARVEEAEVAAGAKRGLAAEELHNTMAEAGHSVDSVMSHYEGLRNTLAADRKATLDAALKLEAERAANAKELEEAVSKLAHDNSHPGAPDIEEILGIMGRKRDPSTRWAVESYLAEHGNEVFATAPAATQLHVDRLRSIGTDLEKAHTNALEQVSKIDAASRTLEREAEKNIRVAGQVADQRVAAFQRTQARGIADAEGAISKAVRAGQKDVEGATRAADRGVEKARADAEKGISDFEKLTTKERATLEKAQAAERKAIPTPSNETEFDPMLAKARQRAGERGPIISGNAGLGAIISLAHGNPFGATAALVSSFAAGRARAEGNFIAARAMRETAGALRTTDDAIRRGAAQVVGRTASSAAMAAARARPEKEQKKKGPEPTFEQVHSRVVAAAGNPQLVDRAVQQALGPVVTQMPETYASTLMAAQRAQHFLENILPKAQKDPHSLTMDVESNDFSMSQKWDFMESAKALNDPIKVYQNTMDGTVTEQQIEAVKFVYPEIYGQMQAEVDYQVRTLRSPLPYDRSIHIGTLLGIVTDDVLEPDFQQALQASYKNKAATGAPVGSKTSSAESKVSKDMMSTKERVERGEP